MNRVRLLVFLLPFVCSCDSGEDIAPGAANTPAAAEAPRRDQPLNFVVITLDTVRADALSSYGQKLPTTPRIDALAADGLLFEQATSSAPSTLPSHSSLFTGKHPYAHGVRSNMGYSLADENVTLAEVLHSRGYATAAEIAAPVLARKRQLAQGFDAYRDPGDTETVLEQLKAKQAGRGRLIRPGSEITRFGLEFLRAHTDEPFLLWLHFFDAHRPYDPLPEFQQRIPESPYHAEVAGLDHAVGLIAGEIERLGLRERTVVVVTADHGEGQGEHGEESHAFFVYDSTMRVPLIFWGADVIPRGRRVAELVRLVDVTPTLLDLVGAPMPAGIQGTSLVPLLRDPQRKLALTGYGESIEPSVTFGASTLRFVREGRWKYIHKLEPELFDVEADPQESNNLAAREPAQLEHLQLRLRELIEAAPQRPEGSEVEMDPADLAQLHALGYVGGAAPRTEAADELASLEVRGPDPNTRIDDVYNMSIAFGFLLNNHPEEAKAIFRQVHERNPDSIYPLQTLIAATSADEDRAVRLPLLRRLIELEPENASSRVDLARALDEAGELDEAEGLYRQALLLEPCTLRARLYLSELLREEKRYAEQVAVLDVGEEGCFKAVAIRNALAYALATSPDDGVRDGERALALSEAAVAEAHSEHPDYLDSVACAQAELGRFDAAIANVKKAIALIEAADVLPEALAIYNAHLARFEANEPAREP